MRKLWLPISFAFFVGIGGMARTTTAMPVTGGTTSILITLDTEELDIDVGAIGLTEEEGGRFVLPISGGDVTLPLSGMIEHEDAGLEFDLPNLPSFELHDLVFDFDESVVSGDLESALFSTNLDLFDLRPCVEGGCTGPGGTMPVTGFGLFLRPGAADVIENLVLGDEFFDDEQQIALADVSLVFDPPVAEPATLALLGLSLASLAFARRPRAGLDA